MSNIQRVYVSGPMTGLPEYNYPAFNRAAQWLRDAGYDVENPAENPAPPCGTWVGYMRLAVAQVARCDALYLLDGWQHSRGAWVEVSLARELELLIDYDRTLLIPRQGLWDTQKIQHSAAERQGA